MKIIRLKQYSKGNYFEFATLVIKDHFWSKERDIDVYRYEYCVFWSDEKTHNNFYDDGFVDSIFKLEKIKRNNDRREKLIEEDKPKAEIIYKS